MCRTLHRKRARYDMITNFTHAIQQVNSHNSAPGNDNTSRPSAQVSTLAANGRIALNQPRGNPR
jgi:hypothetical protein